MREMTLNSSDVSQIRLFARDTQALLSDVVEGYVSLKGRRGITAWWFALPGRPTVCASVGALCA
jgi:hypothetical protein